MDPKDYIKNRVHDLYYSIDMNCARTTMTCISELLEIHMENQTMDAALGLHGAGGFRAQCGLVEGALMMIGVYGKQKGLTDAQVVKLCYEYAERFTETFGALTCRELRPGGFRDDDPPHLCEGLSSRAVSFIYDYLIEKMPV